MLQWTDLPQIPPGYGPSVVTLGNFDGVHHGHRAVLSTVVERARKEGAQAVAVTFEPHPLAVLYPERAPQIITSAQQRLDLLAGTGLDAVLIMEFTREFALWTPERFVFEVFVKALGASVVVVGEDTRFGVRNSGNVDTLRQLGAEHGFEVLALADVGDGGRWSSSRVRALVTSGDVAGAAGLLGRPHQVSGEVVHGDHRGRELGYPTANLSQQSAGLIPADGIYAGWLFRPTLPEGDIDRRLPAAISIGTNPTFAGTQRRVEAYVLDRTDLDLYGETVAVEFVERLRPTERFDSIQDLLLQMSQDVNRARKVLSSTVE
ncbi:MAG: riboflavin kinase / adenylyltransferase [Actinomycetota bacterium]|jgi:riboflavin kinase/FMN adenylyltransferase|nr:riboflavin kinase / adenylyltransferase [Actinomycetota bacterium]